MTFYTYFPSAVLTACVKVGNLCASSMSLILASNERLLS